MHIALLFVLSSLAVNAVNGRTFEDTSGVETKACARSGGKTCGQHTPNDDDVIALLQMKRGAGDDTAVKGDDAAVKGDHAATKGNASAALTAGADSAAVTEGKGRDDSASTSAGIDSDAVTEGQGGDDSAASTEGDDSAAETPMDDLMTALAGVGGGGGGRVGGAAVGRILGNDCGLIARFPRSTASLDLLLAVGFTVVDNAKSSEEEQSEN
eukprot:gnl/TRDRNA2_/TRDRNA2_172436_c1_seq1.p1 gnl/TRDRNA2_/TRDRNA2_172436_c1~~gnl/TRDRNA2_/TRDRNA2_172436_c1_seq1.p1  ORF type:complete len:212 (+),score=27.08 gnl/TRDRNA2_/TRDRNA2_172436_c1_seq1:70-705(+)